MKYNKVIYVLLFFASIILGILIAVFKGDVSNQVVIPLNMILIEAATFFLFLGTLLLIPIVSNKIGQKYLIYTMCFVPLFLIATEIEQYFIFHDFDFIKMLTMLFAFLTFLVLHKIIEQKTASTA